MTTIISPNIKRTSERINPDGDVINPKTKQIIQKNEQNYVPTPEELARIDTTTQPEAIEAHTVAVSSLDTPKSIQEEINATKAKLALLEEQKKSLIEKMKKELEELEA